MTAIFLVWQSILCFFFIRFSSFNRGAVNTYRHWMEATAAQTYINKSSFFSFFLVCINGNKFVTIDILLPWGQSHFCPKNSPISSVSIVYT